MFLFTTGLFALPFAAHASIPFFGPIIPSPPTGDNVCPAGWGMVMIVVNNIIELAITLAIVFVAPLMIAYSGFLFVVNPVNPGGRGKAKDILLNTIVGIIIALAGWLIVDAVMAVLYNPNAAGGTWSSIVTSSGNPCLMQAGALSQLNEATGANIQGINANGSSVALSFGSGACDPAVLQQIVPSLTQNQANTFACIAKPESSCGAARNPPNYNWGKGSSAAGAFQVLLSTNSSCYDNPVCEKAAGVSGQLNCATGFSGGNPKTDPASQVIVQECLQAASDLNCSITAAACLLQQNNGSFSAWTTDQNSSVQAQCIAQYSGS